MPETLEKKIGLFCSELVKYLKQRILTFTSGGVQYTTQIGNEEKRFEKRILVGRLVDPGYRFDTDGDLIATTDKLFMFNSSKGWAFTNKRVYLNLFLERFSEDMDINAKKDPRILEIEKRLSKAQILGGEPPEIKGLRVDIYSERIILRIPGMPEPPLPIGGYTEYDSNPTHSLRVGNELVDYFLQHQNLTVTRVVKSKAELPKF